MSTFDGCKQVQFSGLLSQNEPLAQYLITENRSAESVCCYTVSGVLDTRNMVGRLYAINMAIILQCF